MLAHYDCMTYIIFLLLWLMIYPIAYTKPSLALDSFFQTASILTTLLDIGYVNIQVSLSVDPISPARHIHILYLLYFS
jgi:hypothetical protein